MKANDVLWLSYKDLSGKRVRTALTIVMVIIGIASIIALTSLTAGIGASIQKELSSLGPTTIVLVSTKPAGFTTADTSAISTLPNVSMVIPIFQSTGYLLSGNQNVSVKVVGLDSQYLDQVLGGVNLYQGTAYTDTPAPSSLIGYSVAFPSSAGGAQSASPGKPATLNIQTGFGSTQSYTIPIIGVLQSYGSSILSTDTSVFMPLNAAESLFHRNSFNVIYIEAKNASSVVPLSNQLTAIYSSSATVITTQQLEQTASSIVGALSSFLLIIAGISLLVAAIGIMNIMLMSVMERTHEIGIMKSIGFKSRDVLTMFLMQAVIIGLIGGIIGIIVGSGVAYGLASAVSGHNSTGSSAASGSSSNVHVAAGGRGGENAVYAGGGAPSSSGPSSLSFTPVLTITTVIEAMLVAIIVSALAGLYPAWRASKMQPIDALREL